MGGHERADASGPCGERSEPLHDGQVLARSGPTLFQAALDQAPRRDRELLGAGFIAQSQYDTAYSNQVAADAALSSAIVTARQARMQLSAARSQATAGTAQGNASASQATGFVSGGGAAVEPIGQTLAPGSQIALSLTTRRTETPAPAPGMFR